jgi:hypothetical protein
MRLKLQPAKEVTVSAIHVPKQLRNPHPLIGATRRFYEGVRPDEDGRMRPGPKEGVAHLIVSRPTLGRALRVLQAIFDEAERRGYEVAPSRGYESTGVSIVIGGHAYPVALHEPHDRVPVSDEDIERWRKAREWRLRWEPELKPPAQKSVPNGYLKLLSPTWHGGRSSWSEGPRGPLDRKLPQFFQELERRVLADEQRAEERRVQEQQQQRQREELLRQRERQALRNANAERLQAELREWRTAQDARAYAATIREAVNESETEAASRLCEWSDWIEGWADEADPTRNTSRVEGVLTVLPDRTRFQLSHGLV